MAGHRNIEIIRGTDYTHVVTMKVRVAGVDTVLNITGRTYTAEIRRVKSQVLPDVSMTVTIPTPVNGQIILSLDDSETAVIEVGCGYYWRLTQNASGVISRVLEGKVTVEV